MDNIKLNILYFAYIMVTMYLGDLISNKSGGKIPQMFVVAVVFLIAFLTGFFPKDILQISGINAVYGIISSMILIHVGTLFNIHDMINHYKTVIIILVAMLGICIFCGGLGYVFFGADIGFASVGPLTGGGMAAIIINESAQLAKKPDIGLFASMIFIFQGFVGFPLTAWFLRKECIMQIKNFSTNSMLALKTKKEVVPKKILIQRLVPDAYRNPLFYLTSLAVLALVADYASHITHVNYAIIQIIVGVIAKYLGLLENQPLDKADSGTFLITCLFAWFMGSFAYASLKTILEFLFIIIALMAIASVSIALFCIPLGKKFGYSKYLSLCIGFNCFLGFPFNYALTNEAIRSNSKTKEEGDYLRELLMPKMIVAGVVSVSILSAIIAGLVASYYFNI